MASTADPSVNSVQDEERRLLESDNNTNSGNAEAINSNNRFKVGPLYLFYIMCSFSGQLLIPRSHVHSRLHCFILLSVICCIVLLLTNMGALGFNFYVVSFCPYANQSYFCFGNAGTNSTSYYLELDSLLVSGIGGIKPEDNDEYYNWEKVTITTGTVSGFLSYYMMIILVLVPVYYKTACLEKFKKCSTALNLAWERKNDILLPFFDGIKNKETNNPKLQQSTLLKPEQQKYFMIFYILNLIFFFSSFVVFGFIMRNKFKNDNAAIGKQIFNIIGLVFQFFAEFCAIHSCFIFSKVAYGVSNMLINSCKKLYEAFDITNDKFKEYLGYINVNDDGTCTYEQGITDEVQTKLESMSILKLKDYKNLIIFSAADHSDPPSQFKENASFYMKQARLVAMKEVDKELVGIIRASIAPYGLWFTVHWVLYSITTFMQMAFFVETYIRYIYTPHGKRWFHDNDSEHILRFAYLALYCLTHMLIFAYPCFRAAAITKARADFIKNLNCYSWKNTSASIQTAFRDYLVDQNFGFQLSLCCIKFNFSFNLAFIAIFLSIIGIIMKLAL